MFWGHNKSGNKSGKSGKGNPKSGDTLHSFRILIRSFEISVDKTPRITIINHLAPGREAARRAGRVNILTPQ